jgi:hypothetical protein
VRLSDSCEERHRPSKLDGDEFLLVGGWFSWFYFCRNEHFASPVKSRAGHSAIPRLSLARHQLLPLLDEVAASITRSRLKLPGFMYGGNSRKQYSPY